MARIDALQAFDGSSILPFSTMCYTLEGYPHLLKVITIDPFRMAWVCDNTTGACFRVELSKLSED